MIKKLLALLLLTALLCITQTACAQQPGAQTSPPSASLPSAAQSSDAPSAGETTDAAAAKYAAGDVIAFGCCEQDGDVENGAEGIEWIVLDVRGDSALLLSKYALDAKPYHSGQNEVRWDACTLRAWLNGEFYASAFDEEERLRILPSPIPAQLGAAAGASDKVFLLSLEDATNAAYGFSPDLTPDSARVCRPTAYAQAQGCQTSAAGENTGCCLWWLSTCGFDSGYAASVRFNGAVGSDGAAVGDGYIGVRPAILIKL